MKRERETSMENHVYESYEHSKDNKSNEMIPSSSNSRRENYNSYDKNRKKRMFMQKYYHVGAFFQSNPDDPGGTAGTHDIYRRDFSVPTSEDKVDKTILPKVMQVKNFGRRGRTKWTHLVEEDTSDFNSPLPYHKPLSMRNNVKMGGMDQSMSRPKGNKKLKDWEL